MKKSLITSVAAGALFAGSAMAADMPVKAPLIMKAPPMVYNWTGCYLDGGVGYGMWNQDHSISTTFAGIPGQTIEVTSGGRGWLGRFGGGCDLQLSGTFSNFVIGAFGDYDTMSLKGSLVPQTEINNFPVSGDEKESSAWAVGGRVGYLIAPTVLSYVNGGWSETRFDQVNENTNQGVAVPFAFPAQTYSGWFLGSGFEYNFNWLPLQGLFLRSEYRYASYNQADLAEFDTATGVATGNVLHAKKQVQTITTSLVWRFNWMH